MNEENLLKGISRLKRRRDALLKENAKLQHNVKYLEFRLKHTETLLKFEREHKEESQI
jgi:regulator of replication initiation timing